MQKQREEARKKLFEELKLNDAQISLIDSLPVSLDVRRMEMMEDMRLSFGDRDAIRDIREQMQALKSSIDEQIVALLSQQQQQLWEAVQAKAAQRRSERWGSRRGGGRGGDSSRP